MGKLIKLLIVVAIIAGAGYFVFTQMDTAKVGASAKNEGEPPVKVEEKYGFTAGMDDD